MQSRLTIRPAGHPGQAVLFVILGVITLVTASPAFGGQDYVTRYDLFAGYTFLDSPKIGMFENGFHFQAGVRPRTWVSLGFDYSVSAGDLSMTPNLLPDALQQQLAAQLTQLAKAGKLPAGYVLSVPASSLTQTFAMGPQFACRHFSKVTFFLRPNFGAIREVATPHPGDPIAAGIAQQLAPAGRKTDWQGVYGFGGGADFLFSRHVAFRVQADFVHDHLFNDILKDGRNTVRFSIGPCFNFGRNIVD